MIRIKFARAAAIAAAAFALAACAPQPAFQVTDTPSTRIGTVESVQQVVAENDNSALGAIGGALVGGGIGSLFGGGTGQTVATVVGAAGGAYLGSQAAQHSRTFVWRIGVRYDDGSVATVQQTTAPALRIGDRVRVTNTGIELLN